MKKEETGDEKRARELAETRARMRQAAEGLAPLLVLIDYLADQGKLELLSNAWDPVFELIDLRHNAVRIEVDDRPGFYPGRMVRASAQFGDYKAAAMGPRAHAISDALRLVADRIDDRGGFTLPPRLAGELGIRGARVTDQAMDEPARLFDRAVSVTGEVARREVRASTRAALEVTGAELEASIVAAGEALARRAYVEVPRRAGRRAVNQVLWVRGMLDITGTFAIATDCPQNPMSTRHRLRWEETGELRCMHCAAFFGGRLEPIRPR